jgi:MFS family permease
MSPTFSSLSIYNYRIYFGGALVSNIGTWMGRVAQDWLVLTVLTDHDPVSLGVVTGLQFAPMVLLAPWAGMIADRFAKRRILFATQSMLAITSLLTGVLVVTGVVQLWHVYLLALLQGFATAVDNPARQTFVSEMVPRTSLANAVSLNSASFNAARIIGPGVAGLVIAAVGTGPAFFVNTFSFVAVLLALTQMRAEQLRPAPRTRGKGQIRDGLRYVKGRPDIILIMVLVFVLGTFGMNFQLTTALMATQLFHKGAGEYGLLGTTMAVGSLSGALLAARRAGKPRKRLVILAALTFGVAEVIAGTLPTYVSFAIWTPMLGLSALTMITAANTSVQLSVSPALRGRVMALYMMIFMGGTPLGAPIIGWIGQTFGARWTLIGGGAMTVLGTLLAVGVYSWSRGLVGNRRQPAELPAPDEMAGRGR